MDEKHVLESLTYINQSQIVMSKLLSHNDRARKEALKLDDASEAGTAMCFRDTANVPSSTPVCDVLDNLYDFTRNLAQQYKACRAWLKDAHPLANSTLNALNALNWVYERAKVYDHQSRALTGAEISTLIGSFVEAPQNWQAKAEELPALLERHLLMSKKFKAQTCARPG